MTNRPLVLGHRGAPRRARENTLEAFAIARQLGADGVELDVRRTADGQLVIHHDPEAGDYGLIAGRPFEELRRERPDIPTLVEALGELAGQFVNIEVKCLPWEPDADDGTVMTAVGSLVQARGHYESVVVSSFDLGALGAIRAVDARIPLGWLTSRQAVEQAAPIAASRGVAWLHPDVASALHAPARAVELARENGLRLNVWTVDDPGDVRVLAAAGVDGIITNTPDVALAALA